ncbi:MAG: hypothetical protein E7178_04625 [Erysipelotrichaceae bacterium]|nr:hypothetical protein [Erysipelotrichaceae bacterium]
MKKIHGLLLGSGLLLSALAGAFFFSTKSNAYQEVKADAVDSFYIAGQELTTEAPVAGDSGEASLALTETEAIITLDNFEYSGDGSLISGNKYGSLGFVINSNRDVKIIVKGKNELFNTIDNSDAFSCGVCSIVKSSTKVYFESYDEENKHSLSASGSSEGTNESAGLSSDFGRLYFNGPDLTFTGGDNVTSSTFGIVNSTGNNTSRYCYFNAGTIIANAGSSATSSWGLYNKGQTTITGNNTVVRFCSGNADLYSYGAYLYNQDLYITGGSAYFEGKENGITGGSDRDIYISKTADVTIIGGESAVSFVEVSNSMRGYSWDGENVRSEVDIQTNSHKISASIKKLFYGELEFSVSDGGEVEYTGSAIPVADIKLTKPSSNYDIKYGLTDGEYNLDTCPTCTDVGETATVYYKVSAENYHAKDGTTSVTGSRTIEVVKATGTVESDAVAATDLVYNGQSQDLLSSLPVAKALGTIEYSVNGGVYYVSKPTAVNSGNYNIKYRVKADDSHTESSISEINVTIAKTPGEITTDAVAATGLKYNGQSRDLLSTLPKAAFGGVIEYSINDGEYTVDKPTGINAGDYKVSYRVKADDNHEVSEVHTVNVSIGKMDNYYTNEPRILFDNIYTGEEKELVSEGSAYHGTIYYKLDDGEYSTDVPTRVNVGKYVVYYKVIGGDNYEDIPEKSLSASISPVNKTSLSNLIKSAETYRDHIIDEDPETAATLQEHIDAAIVVKDDLNKNVTEVNNARLSLQNAIENAQASFVMGRISKIPNPVELTEECYAKMTSANEAYDTLSQTAKAKVTNYSVLTGANVSYVKLSIDNIGEVVYSDTSKAKIDAARKYYKAINGTEKSLVTNYSVLQEAEKAYAKLKEDHIAADKVVDIIKGIEDYTYSDDFKAKVNAARSAYSLLTDDQKELVSNVEVLDNAELFTSQIDNAIKKINAIGTAKYPNSGKDILIAKEAYESLSDAQKVFVSNYETLANDELFYNQIDNAVNLISAIGEMKYPDSGQAIADAMNAYKTLADEQKKFVTNYNILITDDNSYNQIDNVYKTIKAIGEVKYPDSEKLILEARSAYNNLSESQKAFVDEDTYNILLNDEAIYGKLSTDHKAAEEVTSLIGRIGAVEYTSACKNKIDAAREAYNALTNDEQRSYVTDYQTLTAAESLYASLKTNYDAANSVRDLINEIGEVNLNSDCKAKIEEARNKYNALSEEQKALVNFSTYESLVNAESTYTSLNNNRTNWTIVGTAVGGAVGLLVLMYVLSFLLFNKWALIDGDVVRVVKVGKKYGVNKVIAMPFRIIYCDNDILFKKKADAINKQSSK